MIHHLEMREQNMKIEQRPIDIPLDHILHDQVELRTFSWFLQAALARPKRTSEMINGHMPYIKVELPSLGLVIDSNRCMQYMTDNAMQSSINLQF